MRKTPQLREVLPIYPAMPFSRLARFTAPGAIRTVRKKIRDQGSEIRGQRSGIRSQDQGSRVSQGSSSSLTPDTCLLTSEKMERFYRSNGLDLSSAPPFHQHCSAPDKGVKT